MSIMKSLLPTVLAAGIVLGLIGIASARVARAWSYQELLDKSDLVAIAIPTATNDTKEQIELPGFMGQRVVGVETKFSVHALFKGDKTKDFVLHHYRPDDSGMIVPNGPGFLSFEPVDNPTALRRTYILFLVREADGRYAPVVGQAEPGLAIRELK